MSDIPYEKECIFCKNKIMMSKQSGNWLPYEKNGNTHDCKKEKKTKENGHNDLSVEGLLKRLQSVGISVDLERLRNI